ncbi:Uncharacterised protein [Mycobacteroides abscessus subsp. abscessus]|nr:Uncharacterised protein [Mycobacteroides abscessus subsp. abscessus]
MVGAASYPPHCDGCSSLKKPISCSSATVASGRRRRSSVSCARLRRVGSRSSI